MRQDDGICKDDMIKCEKCQIKNDIKLIKEQK